METFSKTIGVIGFGIFALLCWKLWIEHIVIYGHLLFSSATTIGEITHQQESQNRDKKDSQTFYYAHYQFLAPDGQMIRGQSQVGSTRTHVESGQKVTIVYCQIHQGKHHLIYDPTELWLKPFLLFMAALGFSFFAFISLASLFRLENNSTVIAIIYPFLALFFFLSGIGMLTTSYFKIRHHLSLYVHGQRTEGKIIGYEESLRHHQGSYRTFYYPKVEFTLPNGQIIHTLSGVGQDSPPANEKSQVTVIYHSDRPQQAIIFSFVDLILPPLALLILSIILFIGSITLMKASMTH